MADEKAEKVLTGKQIMATIQDRADVDLERLPATQAYLWVAKRSAMDVQVQMSLEQAKPDWEGKTPQQKLAKITSLLSDLDPMLLRRLDNWPLADALIFAMFQDAEEVRVYTVPNMPKDMLAAPPATANRYRIAKANPLPVFGVDLFTLDSWMDAIAREMEAVEADEDPAEAGAAEEREKIVSYLESLPAGYLMADAIEDIDSDELHLVDRDDGDDDKNGTESPAHAENGAAKSAEPPSSQMEAASAPAT